MKKLQFRLRALMAERERVTGQNTTYRTIQEATKISPNTLSTMARGKVKKIGIGTVESLLDYFECDVADLIVYEESHNDPSK